MSVGKESRLCAVKWRWKGNGPPAPLPFFHSQMCLIEWKSRCSITLDACAKYVGGTERAGEESLLEIAPRVVSKAMELSVKCSLTFGDEFWVSTECIHGTLLILCARAKDVV